MAGHTDKEKSSKSMKEKLFNINSHADDWENRYEQL